MPTAPEVPSEPQRTFVRELRTGVGALRELVDRLSANPADPEAMSRLRATFSELTTGARTATMPDVVAVCTMGDRLAELVSEKALAPGHAVPLFVEALAALENAEAKELAIRDGLTRCFKYDYFRLRLDTEVARAKRYQFEVALGMVDADEFVRINAEFGRVGGDGVLSRMADLVTASVRSTDVVARVGGEKLAVLLVHAGIAEASLITNRIRERIANHRFSVRGKWEADERFTALTVSIGVTHLSPGDDALALLARAEKALGQAKKAGRNQVQVEAKSKA